MAPPIVPRPSSADPTLQRVIDRALAECYSGTVAAALAAGGTPFVPSDRPSSFGLDVWAALNGDLIRYGKPHPAAVGLDLATQRAGVTYCCFPHVQQLTLMERGTTRQELRALQRGKMGLAFAVEAGVIFFLYRFGDLLLGHTAYSVHLLPEWLQPFKVAGQAHPRLVVSVLDLNTGLTAAVRTATLPIAFTAALAKPIQQQAARPWGGPERYLQAVARAETIHGYRGFRRRAPARIACPLSSIRCTSW
ncbi:MAG: hypothetical protein ACR2OU_08325 [Thermomicrobiales bacterium]